MNKGTKEGTDEEINLVMSINKGIYNDFIKKKFPERKNIYCVHVTQNKFSKISELNVKPKSDAFLVEFKYNINSFLVRNNYYLNEENIEIILQNNSNNFVTIEDSGISVKRPDSKNYQIHKFTPKSFLKVFNNKYIGAGAMIYIMKEADFPKNKKIIENFWKTNEEDFFSYFEKILNKLNNNLSQNDKYKIISKYSLSEIKRMILESEDIRKTIFTGKNDFEEPFGASLSFINNTLEKFKYTNFYVTQGSGRLKTHAIIIKPKI
jgi:hypothetical protein